MFPKFIDRTEIGLAESLVEFKQLVKDNCPNFDEVFRIVPTQTAIWIETHELGSNYFNGKRVKIAERGVEFDLDLVYNKINDLIDANLKIKSIQSLNNDRKRSIEKILNSIDKRQYYINVEYDSYKISFYWNKLFQVKISYTFGSDIININDVIFWNSIRTQSFNDLERLYLDTKTQIEEMKKYIETKLIPVLPKYEKQKT
jgi:hypothetical protein